MSAVSVSAAAAVADCVAFVSGLAAALGDDIDLVPLLHDLVAPQLELAVGDAFAGLDVVLVAVPGAHEMRFGVRKVHPLRGLIRHDPLFDLGDDQPLAGRPALVQAVVAVGVELAAVLEHADLGVADEHDAAIPVPEFRCLSDKLFGHGYPAPPVTSSVAGTAAQARSELCDVILHPLWRRQHASDASAGLHASFRGPSAAREPGIQRLDNGFRARAFGAP